jgi:transposase
VSWDVDPKHWQVVRDQVVLLAAQGLHNEEIAARVNCPREVITQWRKRFYEQCLDGLDQPRAVARSSARTKPSPPRQLTSPWSVSMAWPARSGST